MKPFHLFGVLLASASLQAQNLNQAPGLPAPTPYAVVSQDANSALWQCETYEQAPDGSIVPHLHQYTELATGLNHLVNGQWVATKEEIDISPDGTSASATNGQHQVYFPGNIYNGDIKLVTPDGQTLESQPIGLSYTDGTNSVLLAVVTNSTGAILSSGNQVIYTNAFAGLNADLLYSYTKAGMEQDVVLREQPPDPSSLGLNSAETRLQVLTEFVAAPQPNVTATTVATDAGNLEDDSLGFGVMQMGRGKAFLIGGNSPSVMVDKQWVLLNGRQFLIEEVPVVSIASAIDSLPPFVAQAGTGAKLIVSKSLILPPQRLTRTTPKTRFIAQAQPPSRGLILDYVTMISQTNYTFQGDTTYYISGVVNLSGTNTFEGGAVLKYTNGVSVNLLYGSALNWQGGNYRPVIFTAKDDNSVGAIISGSTGSPTNYYANPALGLNLSGSSTFTVSNFRISWANQAINDNNYGAVSFYNGQLVNCLNGISCTYGQLKLRNLLFVNVQTNLNNIYSSVLNVQNTTFSGSACLALGAMDYTVPTFTNCILANVTLLTNGVIPLPSGSFNGFYNSPAFGTATNGCTTYPFQIAGAGGYYFTNGCVFTDAGTTNIDPVLLANLQQKTVWPPMLYSNVTFGTNMALFPQAARDTNALPDLGYHYDPIDYIVDEFVITNAALTITNGAAIASYNETGVQLQNGSSIVSIGTPLCPNWFIRYSSVQEQMVSLGGTNPGSGITVNAYDNGSVWPAGQYSFSKFACLAGGGYLFDDSGTSSYSNLFVQNCELWSGGNILGGGTNTVTTFRNDLFNRSTVATAGADSTNSLTNNLFWGVSSVSLNPAGLVGWSAYNNAFDSCGSLSSGSGTNGFSNGYNAYLNCTNYLNPTNSTDIFLTNTLAYGTGPLGTFYQPTNSPLIHMGNTNANLLGLYHYTVITNEAVEGTNIVSIGYHYIALNQYGNPLDTDGDGIPDYVEDANGDGIYDAGDPSDWLDYYNGVLPVLTVAPGVEQNGNQHSTTPVPLAVIVTDTSGKLLTNAPLTFAVTQGPALLALTTNGTGAALQETSSDVNGEALVYFVLTKDTYGITNVISATAYSGTNSTSLTFTESTIIVPQIVGGDNYFLLLTPEAQEFLNDQVDTNLSLVFGGEGTNVTQVAVAHHSGTAFAASVGYAWIWLEPNGPSIFPMETNGLTNVSGVSGDVAYAMALKNDGSIWEWGSRYYPSNGVIYTIGDGVDPVEFTNLANVMSISAGPNYGLALLTNGTVWAWGDDGCGEFGDGGTAGTSDLMAYQVGTLTNIVQISAGPNYCMALQSNGVVWEWGQLSPYPDAGVPPLDPLQPTPIVTPQTNGLTNIILISAGGDEALALDADGKLWSWGNNDDGELGIGYNSDGTNDPQQVLIPVTNIISISAGTAGTAYALDGQENIWEWGSGNSTNVPAIINNLHTILIDDNPTVSIVIPTSGASFSSSASISVTANAQSGDSFVRYVTFYLNNSPFGTVTNNNPFYVGWYNFVLQNLQGHMSGYLVAQAVDNYGHTGYSSPVYISISPSSNGEGIPDYEEVGQGNDPLNPWLPPPFDPTDHTAPNITLLIPTNAILVSP